MKHLYIFDVIISETNNLKLLQMKTSIETDLIKIGETYESFIGLNKQILAWGEKNSWYIIINRIPRKGWLVYGLNNKGKQNYHEIGLKLLEDYFDKPITMLNNFINMK